MIQKPSVTSGTLLNNALADSFMAVRSGVPSSAPGSHDGSNAPVGRSCGDNPRSGLRICHTRNELVPAARNNRPRCAPELIVDEASVCTDVMAGLVPAIHAL